MTPTFYHPTVRLRRNRNFRATLLLALLAGLPAHLVKASSKPGLFFAAARPEAGAKHSTNRGSYPVPSAQVLATDLVVSSPMVITPGTYNSITVQNGGVATLAGDVTVDSFVLVQDGGTLDNAGFFYRGTGDFTLAAGGTLIINRPSGIQPTGVALGAVRMSGTRTYSADANYVYSGANGAVTGNGLPSQVRNLTIGAGAASGNINLSRPVAVAQTLTLNSNIDLATTGQTLTLLSSATGTALIVNSSTGQVLGGNVVAQRYLDPSLNAGVGYRHLSSPVGSFQVSQLGTTATGGSFTPNVSQAAAYNASASPGTVTPFPTVFAYDQSRVLRTSTYSPFDRGFVVPASGNSVLATGQGYAVHLNGGETLNFQGSANSGTYTVNLSRNAAGTANAAEAGWALVGNPYPAPLDWSLVLPADRPGLDAAMYVYESSGPYSGSYRASVNGVGGNSNSGTSLVAMAQGFFVRVGAGQTSGSLTFRDNQRVSSYATQLALHRTTADTRPLVQLALRGSTGPADILTAYAQPGATADFDGAFDAVKLPNPSGLNMSSTAASGEAVAIDGRPDFTPATVLPLNVGVPAAGTYTLTAAALNNIPTTLDAYLWDAATGQTVNLRQQAAYTFSLSPAQATALVTDRFALRFATRTALAAAPALAAAEVSLFPNPAHDAFVVELPTAKSASPVQLTLHNALGQVVRTASATGSRIVVATGDLAAGVYTLRLLIGTSTLTKRVVIQ